MTGDAITILATRVLFVFVGVLLIHLGVRGE